MTHPIETCTAFIGRRRLASGPLSDVALRAKAAVDADSTSALLVFDDATSRQVEVDLRGTAEDVAARFPVPEAQTPRGRGRPKLGVTAREVTLLPRHWDWLAEQPGGASVALRKLVDAARHAAEGPDRIRLAQESAYRFTSVMAGDLPGYEEALRALYLKNRSRFDEVISGWPVDIADHARRIADPAFADS